MDERDTGLCEICAIGPKKLRCRLCGAQVCEDCMSSDGELCEVCHESRCYICGEYLSSRACNVCGGLVCEDHGTRENEATICINCRRE